MIIFYKLYLDISVFSQFRDDVVWVFCDQEEKEVTVTSSTATYLLIHTILYPSFGQTPHLVTLENLKYLRVMIQTQKSAQFTCPNDGSVRRRGTIQADFTCLSYSFQWLRDASYVYHVLFA